MNEPTPDALPPEPTPRTDDTQPDNTPTKRRPIRNAIAALTTLGALAVLLCFTLGTLGRHHWTLDLFAHFRIQYTLALTFFTITLLATCAWRRAVITLIFTIALAWSLTPFLEIKRAYPPTRLRIVHFNVFTPNPDHARVLDYLETTDADLISLQEVSASWLESIRAREDAWEVVAAEPRTDGFGIALLRPRQSQLRIDDAKVIRLIQANPGIPTIEAHITTDDGERASMLFTHAYAPINRHYARSRDQMIEQAGRWAMAEPNPALIMGDLNATPWCAPFKQLLAGTDLHNTMRGIALQPSWPTRLPSPLRIPIDHCLTTPEWRTGARDLGPDLGSDHLPLIVVTGLRTPPDTPPPPG